MVRIIAALMLALLFSPLAAAQIVPSPEPAVVVDCSIAQCIGKPLDVSTGTVLGQVLGWLTAAFGSTIGAVLTAWLLRLFKKAGLDATEVMSEKLQRIIVNGINIGAAAAQQGLQGKGKVEIKNETVARAVQYTQEHAADTIKALGLDPESGRAVEAIKARIETAISDPAVPTPAVLDAPGTPPKESPTNVAVKVT